MRTDAVVGLARHAAVQGLQKKRRFSRRQRTVRRLRRQARMSQRHQPGTIELEGFTVHHVDLMSVFMEYKDIFGERIYHFDSARPDPRVIDGGGFIGMSVLYFKSLYPGARVTCFEPDPEIFAVLERNVADNNLRDVELVQAGLAGASGTASFSADGADGGRLVEHGQTTVKTVPLSTWLDEPVDFLKLNIEGFELEVLEEAADKLGNVSEMVVEYHGWPDGPQRLGPLLDLLDRSGFRYLVNHFDYETNGAARPPFKVSGETPWFALVYARRDT